jgi:integrase
MARKRARQRGIFEKLPGSGIWWIRYADRTGRIRREVAGIRGRAIDLYGQRKREELLAKQSPELAAAKAAAGATFGALAEDALAYARARHASLKTTEGQMTRMLGWWRAAPAVALTAQEIEARFDSMRLPQRKKDRPTGPVSAGTFNRYRSLLSLVYRLAQKNGKVPVGFNPARLVEPRAESKRVRWLSADEEKKLREVLEREYPDKPWVHVLDLALNCGLRWGDQARLSAAARDGDSLRLLVGKTDEPLSMTLNARARAAFAALEAEAGQGPLAPTQSNRHWFRRACRLAGIENFRWHDLRHTFATRLLQAGIPAEQVQRLLGHRSIVMTLRYAHVVDGFQAEALRRLAELNDRCAQGGAAVVSIAAGASRRKRKRGGAAS